MFCEKCGTNLGNIQAGFCSECGNKVQSAMNRGLTTNLTRKNIANKKIIIISLVVILGAVLGFYFARTTPEKVLTNFVQDYNKGNIVSAIENYTNAQYTMDPNEYASEMRKLKLEENQWIEDLRKSQRYITIRNMNYISKSKYTCTLNVIADTYYGRQTDEIKLIKIGGKWLIDIESSNGIF